MLESLCVGDGEMGQHWHLIFKTPVGWKQQRVAYSAQQGVVLRCKTVLVVDRYDRTSMVRPLPNWMHQTKLVLKLSGKCWFKKNIYFNRNLSPQSILKVDNVYFIHVSVSLFALIKAVEARAWHKLQCYYWLWESWYMND